MYAIKEMDSDTPAEARERRRVSKISRQPNSTLPNRRFGERSELHQYVKLTGLTRNPDCEFASLYVTLIINMEKIQEN